MSAEITSAGSATGWMSERRLENAAATEEASMTLEFASAGWPVKRDDWDDWADAEGAVTVEAVSAAATHSATPRRE